MNTIIVTDSCADLPLSFIEKYQLPVIGLGFTLKGKEYEDDLGKTISSADLYNAERQGEIPTTTQINTQRFIDFFSIYLEKGLNIIYIAFSSALSGTCGSALVAKEMLKETYSEQNITVIDSLSASLGQGLLVYYAVTMQQEGESPEKIVEWVEQNKLRVNHWFTVEDLNHLKRGGRVSSAAAIVGTILDIKPILHVNDEGKLVPVEKVKGRKKSLRRLAEFLDERITDSQNQIVFISHGDAAEDAKALESLVRSRKQIKDVIINPIGPVIGSHAGPGTIALFFLADYR